MVHQSQFIARYGTSSNCHFEELNKNVSELFIGPFGSSLKNECFVGKDKAYCVVYEQKHAIEKSVGLPFRYVDYGKYKELQRFEIIPGDIIVSCRGTVGEVFLIPHGAPVGIMHPSIMKIRLNPISYIADFFVFAVEEYMRERESKNLGTGVKMAVTAGEMGKDFFPKPSLGEQKAFVNVVRQADKSKFDGLKSQFIELVQRCNPEKKTLESICTRGPQNGFYRKGADIDGTIPIVKMSQLFGFESMSDVSHFDLVSLTEDEIRRFSLTENDLLFGRRSLVPEGAGKCRRAGRIDKTVVFESSILRVSIDPAICYPRFVQAWTESPEGEQAISELRAGTSVVGITGSGLSKVIIPVPTKSIQDVFIGVAEQADKSKYLN